MLCDDIRYAVSYCFLLISRMKTQPKRPLTKTIKGFVFFNDMFPLEVGSFIYNFVAIIGLSRMSKDNLERVASATYKRRTKRFK